jgi:hypothetical protein
MPIAFFLFLRWMWRYGVWTWFLRKIAGLDLHLTAGHPDRAGGLGFVKLGHSAFADIFFALSCVVASAVGNEILNNGASLTAFQTPLIIVGVIALGLALAPLLVFRRTLVRAKRRGMFEYGKMATAYVQTFERKWLGGKDAADEELSISADIQGLADLGGSFDRVSAMSRYFIDLRTTLYYAIALAVPIAPLVLTEIPLQDFLMLIFNVLA